MQICSKCSVPQPREEFTRNKYWCNSCMRMANREWRKKNPDHNRLYLRAYYEDEQRAQKRRDSVRKVQADYPERHAEREIKRRASKRQTQIEEITYNGVIERYGTICYLCGIQIEMELRYPHPLSRTFEHIIPLASGGSHTYDNVRLAHFLCNVRKGKKNAT